MTTGKKINLFVKKFIARATGNDNEAEGIEALEQADSALNTQIYSLKGDIMELKRKVKDAETNLDIITVNNGKRIPDRNKYVNDLLVAQNGITLAKEELKAGEAKVAFLEERLEYIKKEVDAE